MKRVAIYVRVSTEEQARGKNNSLDSQEYRCRQYIGSWADEQKPDSIQLYREEGYSGKDTNRPEFQRLMSDVRRGEVHIIVFTELSRVSRNVVDFLHLVEEFKRTNLKFISLREQFDTTSYTGKLLMTVMMALHQFEREQTADRTKQNMRARAEKGLWSGGRFPLGLAPIADMSGHLQVDPEGAGVVKALFQTYVETGSIARTIESLEERGIRRPATRTAKGIERPAEKLTDGSVRGILKSPTYIGLKELNPRKRNLAPEDAEKLPELERYRTLQAVWPAIVPEELFNRANRILKQNAESHRCSIKRKKHEYLLSGLVRCHDCDQLLEVESAKSNTFFYYRHPKDLQTPHCRRSRWRAEVVEEAVIGRLHKLANDDGLFEQVQQRADEALKQEEPELRKELKHAKARLDRLETERTNLTRALTKSESQAPDSFWADARKKDEEAQKARDQLRAKESELAAVQGRTTDSQILREALQNVDALFHELPADEKRRFLHAVVDSLAVKGDNSITLFLVHEAESWNKALGVKRPWAKYPRTTSWLRQQDLNLRPAD